MSTTGIFWFTNDLRLHDQRALLEASQCVESLACVYILDPRYHLIHETKNHCSPSENFFSRASDELQKISYRPSWGIDERSFFGEAKQHFLYQSLTSLAENLGKLNQELLILSGPAEKSISELSDSINATKIFRSNHAGCYENNAWINLQSISTQNRSIDFSTIDTHTIFSQSDINFILKDFPTSFSKFRKVVENYDISQPIKKIDWLPAPPANLPKTLDLGHFNVNKKSQKKPNIDRKDQFQIHGSENFGLEHLEKYFSTKSPSTYKETRNELDGWQTSTKFSLWLANGSLSAKKILSRLRQYEDTSTQNDSTYWILFELLWREYFQWYSHNYGYKLFIHKGIKASKPLTSFYSERYQRWCSGSTQYPLVNALMKQLNATGYMSNRGRQIVASCFVHELQLDWRYGAAYFERQLIDYDVASNWGNWQYLAGVGADPRGHRHFDIGKQTIQFDPKHIFIEKWAGSSPLPPHDSVDAADWPLSN